FRDFQFGYAGAMSMFLFVAIITLALIQSKVLSGDVEYKG
ncbi:MAG TPA: sugar ABC transporter permease, partial [Firmicutes bacterium]|nr:sugar ABC transporter permease [Bacillota bacterium]